MHRRWPSRAAVALLVAHVVGAVCALLLLPHGFALSDKHAWTNTVLPIAAIAVAIVALVRHALVTSASTSVGALVSALTGARVVRAVTGALLFPASVPLDRAVVLVLIAIGVVAVALRVRASTSLAIASFVVGGAVGALVVFAQRAPLPSTRPAGGALAQPPQPMLPAKASSHDRVSAACGRHALDIRPLLTFESRSPDRAWTILAPHDAFGDHSKNTWSIAVADGFRAGFADDGESTLIVQRRDRTTLDLEAVSRLARPVYAHLDSFTTIDFAFDASIAFSAITSAEFPIEPADDPRGRPMKLAYLGADHALHVARARDAEKGPFTELAAGPLERGDPLTIELRAVDDGGAGCRITFLDWSAQVSTEASPTAGWGLPQNSIQFASHAGASSIVLTLADTGPGRGFDSVGHAAGTYRNRVRIEALRASPH